MAHPLSLAFLTVFDAGPVEAVRIAAETGYDLVGLRFLPAAAEGEGPYPVLTDAGLQRELAAALRDTGIGLADIEIVRLGPTTDVAGFARFLDLGERLGARNVLVAGDDPDHDRLAATFARFCDLAAAQGLTADLEFMPWTAVKTLAQARAIVAAAGKANGGVLVDAIHLQRSGSTLAEVAALPPRMIHYAQICDAPGRYDASDAGLIATARGARLYPGEGDIDLAGLVPALPAETVLSLEIPHLDRARTQTPAIRAREALIRTRDLLAGLAEPAGSRDAAGHSA